MTQGSTVGSTKGHYQLDHGGNFPVGVEFFLLEINAFIGDCGDVILFIGRKWMLYVNININIVVSKLLRLGWLLVRKHKRCNV